MVADSVTASSSATRASRASGASARRRSRFGGRSLLVLLIGLLVGLLVGSARAHEGPPFRIITDHEMGSFTVTVWADPDIGTGTFFVVIEPRSGERLPMDLGVEVGVAPTSGRLEEAVYEAEPQDVDTGARFMTEVEFDRGETWNVRIRVTHAEGVGEVSKEVEATPDGGIGPWGMVLYLIPFLAVGFLWVKAILRRRRARAAEVQEAGEAEST